MLRAGSHDQLRALIDPIGGIEVRVAWASEEDIGEQEERYTATSSNQDLDGFFFVGTPDFIFYFYNSISCPDAFDDTGAATCHVFAGGFSGKYVWRKVGARAYLIRIEEQSH